MTYNSFLFFRALLLHHFVNKNVQLKMFRCFFFLRKIVIWTYEWVRVALVSKNVQLVFYCNRRDDGEWADEGLPEVSKFLAHSWTNSSNYRILLFGIE